MKKTKAVAVVQGRVQREVDVLFRGNIERTNFQLWKTLEATHRGLLPCCKPGELPVTNVAISEGTAEFEAKIISCILEILNLMHLCIF